VCLASWPGYTNFTNAEQSDVIRKLFGKAHRWGPTKSLYNADELFEMRDQRLFKSMCRPNTVFICYHQLKE